MKKKVFCLAFVICLLFTLSLPVFSISCVAAGNGAPVVSSLPDTVTIAAGKSAIVKVNATTKSGTALRYQWFFADLGSSVFRKSSIVTSTYNVTMTSQRHGRKVYCVVSDGKGNSTKSETVTLNIAGTLAVKEQPKSVTATSGSVVKIPVTATGKGTLKYQWYYANFGSSKFYKSSINTSVYKVTMNNSRAGRKVYCVITDSTGKSVTTETVTLKMKASINIRLQCGDVAAKKGQIVSVPVRAVGKSKLTYQWYVRKAGGKQFYPSSITTDTYSAVISDLSNGRQVYCVVKDQYGHSVTTDIITLSICKNHTFNAEAPMGKLDDEFVFTKECTKCRTKAYAFYDSLLTFVDDDGKMQAMVHWENIIDATGIRMDAALIGSQMTDTTDYDTWYAYAGWDLLSRLQDKGVEFVNHTYSHKRMTTLTEKELHEDFRKVKEALAAYGIDSNILVYPFNAHNDLVDSVAAQYFDAAFCGRELVITDVASDPYGLTRVNINDSSTKKVIKFTESKIVECIGVKQLPTLKAEMRDAIDENGWLVCLSHAYDSPSGKYYFDEACEQIIIDFCHYVQSLGNVKIVTLSEGLAASNVLEK